MTIVFLAFLVLAQGMADLENARREHLKSAEHKSRVAGSKHARALGGAHVWQNF